VKQSRTSAVGELERVAAIMVSARLDSVEMPSGLKVLKTTHLPFAEAPPSPDAVNEAAARRLEALGIVNATEESGRVPIDQDEVMFAASRAAELSIDAFRPAPEQPVEEPSDGHDDTD